MREKVVKSSSMDLKNGEGGGHRSGHHGNALVKKNLKMKPYKEGKVPIVSEATESRD